MAGIHITDIEASIVDTRVREISAQLREQAQER